MFFVQQMQHSFTIEKLFSENCFPRAFQYSIFTESEIYFKTKVPSPRNILSNNKNVYILCAKISYSSEQ